MIHRHLAFALPLLVAAGAGRADESSMSPSPDAPLRTVVLGLQARRGVDAELAQVMSDVVQGVLAKDRRRVVLGREDIARLVDFEADKQAVGCEDDGCLAEIGRALDARRLVTGSLALVGERFLVVLSELDTETVTPVGRAQEQVDNDEQALLEAVTRLASKLLASEGAIASSPVAEAGSIAFSTEPAGAEVFLDGVSMGTTPVRLDNLAVGAHRLRLVRRDYDTVETEVRVYTGGVTTVAAALRIDRALAEKNYSVRAKVHEDRTTWHYVFASAKAATAGVCCLAGGAIVASNLAQQKRAEPGTWLLPGGLAVAGVALGAVAGLDFVAPPAPPTPEWEEVRKLRITPPAGQGEPVEIDLSAAMPH